MQCHVLCHAAIVYPHTSMWDTEGPDTGRPQALEIEQRASTIVREGGNIVGAGQCKVGFVVFPQFIAGIASSLPSPKELTLDLQSRIKNSVAEWDRTSQGPDMHLRSCASGKRKAIWHGVMPWMWIGSM